MWDYITNSKEEEYLPCHFQGIGMEPPALAMEAKD